MSGAGARGQVRWSGQTGGQGYFGAQFRDHFEWLLDHLEAILAPLGPPGGPLGSKYPPLLSLDSPRILQESLQEPPGADLGLN